MTGFGRGGAAGPMWLARVEISSVNRKQSEVVVLLPKELTGIEPEIRKRAQSAVSRGRVQIHIALEPAGGTTTSVRVDAALARGLDDACRLISEAIGRSVQPQPGDFLRQPGLITLGARDIAEDEARAAIEPALAEALARFNAMRESEGADLHRDLENRLAILAESTVGIAALAPGRPARQRELMLRRLREAGLELDPADERVAREIALFADRCDITEELTRLDSHFGKFRELMAGTEPPGRALDFLCQEIFREFNTIGSKANDAAISHAVVAAKTELEKIREQIQNIE